MLQVKTESLDLSPLGHRERGNGWDKGRIGKPPGAVYFQEAWQKWVRRGMSQHDT